MPLRNGLPIAALAMHIVLWVALVAASFVTAGPYTLASCWHVGVIYFPPLAVLLLMVIGYSSVVLLVSIASPAIRTRLSFYLACHGVILMAGLPTSNQAAFFSAGQVSCL